MSSQCGAFCSFCGRCGRTVTGQIKAEKPKDVLPPGVPDRKKRVVEPEK